ncbi:MAG TPA: bifunctional YncE family protein/alkaline phosphatase family protein [Longimicrobiales bacterium]
MMNVRQSAKWFGPAALLLLAACGSPAERSVSPKAGLQPRLPTGNYLDPAGHATQVGSFPLSAVLSPEGDRVVLLLNGWREQGIQVVDRVTGRTTQTVTLPAAFIGIDFAPDGKTLYVSGGNQDVVYRFDWSERTATLRDSIVLAHKEPQRNGRRYPAGVRVSRDGRTLYVAENLADSLAIIDLASGTVVQRAPAGRYPYDVVEDTNGNVLVSAWGDNDVVMIEPGSWGQAPRVLARIDAGRHPSALALSADGSRLYAASASTDRVAVIDMRARRAMAQLYGPPQTGPGEGSTPNALALSPDGQRLYVAEADNNAVAVWNLRDAQLAGRVPVEWYPTALLASGDSLLVVNGKGSGTGPNPALPHPGRGTQNSNAATRHAYTLGQLNGSITTLTGEELDARALVRMTQRVARANGWGVRNRAGRYPPFEHVIYIIKENRTYDQVLGDVAQADGDTSLVYFPRAVSPNHHALAERFGLFDRFFVNAEVSADGHNWSTAAYATDYLEKTVQSEYSDRGRSYDYEGSNRGRIPSDEGEDDAAEPANGYLWDLAERAHITLRNYGEFVVPVVKGSDTTYRGVKPYLAGNTHPRFPDFDMDIPDQVRADIYLADLRRFVSEGNMPQLQIIRLPNDHTSGARAGARTPRAHVADNDLALGRIIEALSGTPFWRNTVVFVLEDDAQNGPDHVDSHRSPLFVISAYNRGGVIHRFANTTDVIATMAEILKMGSLSQFDYHGRPLREIFSREPDLAPYTALEPQVDMDERNPARGRGAIESQKLKLAREDQSDDELFNRILWTAIKGDRPFPGATRMSRLPVPVLH